MFEITEEAGSVKLAGRLDAAQAITAEAAFDAIDTSSVVDLQCRPRSPAEDPQAARRPGRGPETGQRKPPYRRYPALFRL